MHVEAELRPRLRRHAEGVEVVARLAAHPLGKLGGGANSAPVIQVAARREVGVLYLVALVARAVEPERRRPALSWSHHREVAHLDAEQQDAALELAEREELSTTALREQLRVEHAEAA